MTFQNLIVIILIAAIFVLLLVSFLKKFTAGESCCGTQLVKVRQKRLRKTAGTVTLHIEGMHCENCKKEVIGAVNSLEGHCAKVNLLTKECRVSYEREPDLKEIVRRIEEKGFAVSATEEVTVKSLAELLPEKL